MNDKTIFKKIIDGEIPADVVYEDDRCMAFRDVNPKTPTHVLVIPKKEIASVDEMDDVDVELFGHSGQRFRDNIIFCPKHLSKAAC